MSRPRCGVRPHANGTPCARPASPKSAVGQCERHRRLSIYRAIESGLRARLPIAVRFAEEGED